MQMQITCMPKEFVKTHFDEYHDLSLKSDALLLVNFFKNFRKIFLKIYELDPVKFFFSSQISMATSFRKD